MSSKKWFFLSMALVLVLSFMVMFTAVGTTAPTPGATKPIKWIISFWGGPGSRVWPIHPWWVEEMEKRSGGRFTADVKFGAVLAPAKEKLDGIKARMYEAAHFAPLYAPGKTPLATIFELPLLAPSNLRHLVYWEWAMLEHAALKRELEQRWDGVYIGPHHTRGEYTFFGVNPIKTVEDLKGQRIRIGGAAAEPFKAFGAVPTMMPAPEVYEALMKGMLHQAYLSPVSHHAYKIHEVAKYFTYNMGVGYGMLWAFVANKHAWAALPEDIKEIHRKLIPELQERYIKEVTTENERIFAEWKKRGIEFTEFPAAESEKLAKEAMPAWDKWVADMEAKGLPGRDLLKYALEQRKKIAGY